MTSDVKMQNYLADVTDALTAGHDTDGIRRRYGIGQQEHDEFMQLIHRVDSAFSPVMPTAVFKHRLRAELLNEPQPSVFWQVRRLPARVQFAALVTLLSGFAMFFRRRFFGDPEPEANKNQKEEIHVLR